MEIIETNFDYGSMTPRSISQIDRIILHHAGAEHCTAEDIDRWHKANGWAGIGYNFFVNKAGEIYRCRPMEYVPAHCSGYNTCSIGVCFEGNFEYEWMDSIQIESGKWIVSYLKELYGISDVGKHNDYNATDCPGANFPFSEIVSGEPVPPVPPTPPTPSTPTERVMTVQRWLNEYGYDTYVDGIAGEQTFKNIVKVYQNELNKQFGAGLDVDGVYGDKTYEASWRTISKGASGNITKSIQAMLIAKGYEVALDGDYGDDTEFTVSGYQNDVGLKSTGKVDQDTSAQLYT